MSTPPRLIRRIRNVVDAAAGDQQLDRHRKLTVSRSAGELTAAAGNEPPVKAKVAVDRPTSRATKLSRFSYIYGSVSDDDGDDAGGTLATLDRPIPVYEEFKSATARSSLKLHYNY